MPETPFHLDPVLTAIAVAYRNDAYIADLLCPRAPVGDQEFRYTEYPLAENYTIVDTRVGRLSQPNTVSVSGTEKPAFTEDFGLDGPIPHFDLTRDRGQHDIKGRWSSVSPISCCSIASSASPRSMPIRQATPPG